MYDPSTLQRLERLQAALELLLDREAMVGLLVEVRNAAERERALNEWEEKQQQEKITLEADQALVIEDNERLKSEMARFEAKTVETDARHTARIKAMLEKEKEIEDRLGAIENTEKVLNEREAQLQDRASRILKLAQGDTGA